MNLTKILLILSVTVCDFAQAVTALSPIVPTAQTNGSAAISAGGILAKAIPETNSSDRFIAGSGAAADCITDSKTGLMWAKNANLIGYKPWSDALSAVAAMNSIAGAPGYKLCGYSDWRLPNVNELKSLLIMGKTGKTTPAALLSLQGFVNVHANYYWSSTTYGSGAGNAWGVGFDYGHLHGFNRKRYYIYGWPVRSGQ